MPKTQPSDHVQENKKRRNKKIKDLLPEEYKWWIEAFEAFIDRLNETQNPTPEISRLRKANTRAETNVILPRD